LDRGLDRGFDRGFQWSEPSRYAVTRPVSEETDEAPVGPSSSHPNGSGHPSSPAPLDVSSRFGLRLRELRRERNLTQLRMARDFGIDRSFISDVERGRKSHCRSCSRTCEPLPRRGGGSVNCFRRPGRRSGLPLSSMLELEFAEQSDCGLKREGNEDALGHVRPATAAQVRDQGWLFVLADGMGGHAQGEVASQLAVDTMLAGFRKIPKGVVHASLLPKLVQEANTAVYEEGRKSKARGASMGTTLVACALRFDSAVIAHVGDSRCYLFRNGAGVLLTRDHTMAAEQLRLGILSSADLQSNGIVDHDPQNTRNLLTRSLGFDLFVAADVSTVNVIPGDILLLCSDGLHGYVSDADIEAIVDANSEDLTKAAAALVAAANDAGGHDNVSVQLVRVVGVERMGLYRGRPYRLL
jgi:serine/threonine protein phosphatase PrpC